MRSAVALMLGALTFYSVGVWSERLSRHLRAWHVVLFWVGFVCDAAGTELMRRYVGGFRLNVHAGTGAAALVMMLAHASWATAVLVRRDERAIHTFHRVSVFVWTAWLVPFFTGALLA